MRWRKRIRLQNFFVAKHCQAFEFFSSKINEEGPTSKFRLIGKMNKQSRENFELKARSDLRNLLLKNQ